MRLSWKAGLSALLLAVGLVTLAAVPARTADDKKPADKAEADKVPLAGTWKATFIPNPTLEVSWFILKITDKDGKPEAETAWVAEQLKGANLAVENAKVDAKSVKFTLSFANNKWLVTTVALKDPNDKEPKFLYGTAKANNQYYPFVLEKTDLTELTAKEIQKVTPGAEELQKANREKDEKAKVAAYKEILDKFAGKPIAIGAAEGLFQTTAKHAEKDDEVAAALKQYLAVLNPYGPELEEINAPKIARTLLAGDKGATLALDYARKVEKALPKDAPVARQLPVMKLVAKALHKNKKDDEAKALDEKVAKLDKELDEEFEKTAIPFEPEAFKGRKASSHRVAVVELFTGAQCPPCVSADVAFDAAVKTYKPKDVVLLEYHLHIPAPDPLTNADSEGRQKFYGSEIRGTPTAFVIG